MHEDRVARNYAEVLLSLATKADNRDGFGAMIRDLANAMTGDITVRRFLESPRVSAEDKTRVVAEALNDRVPRLFLRFVETVISHRRQMLIPEIAAEYAALVDEAEGRVHAEVMVARPVDEAETRVIAEQLSRTVGKRVVPHVVVQPEIIGGIVVKLGDVVMDGSVRRRLQRLAQRMRAPA